MIKSLFLENIKSYERGEFTFTPGTNSIIGENGAGKTTILEAIGFVLFDSLPYKLGDFLRRGSSSGEIRLVVVSRKDEREYKIVRKIRKNSTSEYYVMDMELKTKIGDGKTDVLAWIRDHLQLSEYTDLKTFFENAVGVPQGAMTSHFLLPPSARKEVFSPLLGLNVYSSAYEKSREYEKYLYKKIQDLQIEISRIEKEIELTKEHEAQLKVLLKEIDELSRTLKEKSKTFKTVKKEKEFLDKLKEEISTTEGRVNVLEEKISGILRILQDIDHRITESFEAKKNMELLQKEYQEYISIDKKIRDIGDLVRKMETHRKEYTELIVKKSRLTQVLTQIDEELKKINQAESRIPDLKKEAKLQEDLEKDLKQAERSLQLLTELETQYHKIEKREQTLAKDINELLRIENQTKELEERLKKLDELEKKKDKLMTGLASISSKIKLYKENIEFISNGRCPFIEEDCTRVGKKAKEIEKDIQELSQKIIRGKKALETVNELIKKLRKEEEEYRELKGRLIKFSEYNQELMEVTKEREELEERIEVLKKDASRIKDIQDRLESLMDSKKELHILLETIRKKEELMEKRQQTLEEINSIEEELKEIVKTVKQLEQLESERDQLLKKRDEKKSAYEAYLKYSEKAANLNTLYKKKEKTEKELQKHNSDIEEVKSKLTILKEQYDPVKWEKLKERVEKLSNEMARIEGELGEKNKQVEDLKKKIEKLNELNNRYKEFTERIAREEEKLKIFKEMRIVFKEAIPAITKAYVEIISLEANRLFNEIMGDYSWTLEWGKDFGIRLKYHGKDMSFHQLSGGEQMVAAISVRLALLKALSEIDIAFFDEPTQNMDEIRRSNLAQQLRDIGGFTQLFVISHDDTFEEVTDNSIKLENVNGVTVVVQ